MALLAGAVVALTPVLAGCTPGPADGGPDVTAKDVADARARWDATGRVDYSYEFEGTCGEQLLVGRMRVTVTGGEVTGVVPLDDPTQWALDPSRYIDVPTIPDLFDQLAAAAASDGTVEATFHPSDGHPMALVLDPTAGVDDETCATATAVTPL